MTSSARPARSLAAFLAGAGAMHFVVPRFYDTMIPPQLPGGARTWTYGSGAAEIGVAAAVAVPRTRRLGTLAAALLFIAVLPGNLKMYLDAHRGDRPLPVRLGRLLRLPLQLPLIAWAVRAHRSA